MERRRPRYRRTGSHCAWATPSAAAPRRPTARALSPTGSVPLLRDEVARPVPRRLVLGRKPDDHIGMHGSTRDRVADARDEPRIEPRVIPSAHASQDTVIAGLERQVEVRQAAVGMIGPDAEQ